MFLCNNIASALETSSALQVTTKLRDPEFQAGAKIKLADAYAQHHPSGQAPLPAAGQSVSISTLVANYQKAVLPWIDEIQKNARYELELAELYEYIRLQNSAILKAYHNLLKSLIGLLEPNSESIVFVYPFSGADTVTASVAKTFIINLGEKDTGIGARHLTQALEPEVSETDILRNIINRTPALNAMKPESYAFLDDPYRKNCILILKGFSDFARRNAYNAFPNNEEGCEKAVATLIRGIFQRLREGDKVLVLDRDDVSYLKKMGVTDGRQEVDLFNKSPRFNLSLGGCTFIVPDTVLVLTKIKEKMEEVSLETPRAAEQSPLPVAGAANLPATVPVNCGEHPAAHDVERRA